MYVLVVFPLLAQLGRRMRGVCWLVCASCCDLVSFRVAIVFANASHKGSYVAPTHAETSCFNARSDWFLKRF